MTVCTSCGHDVTGKKFCPACGNPVQPAVVASVSCPRCSGDVKPGAAFCMHCGCALHSAAPAPAATHFCPACSMQVAAASAFCTNCGHDMRAPVAPSAQPATLQCRQCGYQNAASMRFCSSCGSQLVAGAAPATAYTQYTQSDPYQQQPAPGYQQPYPQQYQQYPQYPQQYQQPQAYGQPQYGQNPYQAQPMVGQGPMVLHCPTCMAMAPLGSANCVSCRTSLAGIMPAPANMAMQGQQGGFLQGNGGKLAMGALGGAAAVIGGEMLLHGIERSVENGMDGDMGYGRRHHRDEGLLGGLGELADDIGL